MVKIFLAGGEYKIGLIKKIKPHYVLISFYPFYEHLDSYKKAVEIKNNCKELMVDSGAFTFIMQGEKEIPPDYIEQYASFVKRVLPKYYITIDVGDIEQQKKYHLQLVENYGLDPVPVYHTFDKSEEYLKWIVEHKTKDNMIMIGGYASDRLQGLGDPLDRIAKIVNKALQIDKEIKIHILGMTSEDGINLLKEKIYSIDSTSWIGARYGVMYYFEGNKIKIMNWADCRSKVAYLGKKYGIDEGVVELVKKGNGDAIDEWNVVVWKKYQEMMDMPLQEEINKDEQKPSDLHTEIVSQKLENKAVDKLGRDINSYRFNAVKHGLYAKKLRGLLCNYCPIKEKCINFQQDAICYYEKTWRKIGDIRDRNTLLKLLDELIQDAYYRWNRARAFQDAEGGYEDRSVLNLEKHLANLIELKDKLQHPERYASLYNINMQKQQNLFIMQEAFADLDKKLEKYQEVMEKWKQRKSLQFQKD